MPEQPPQASDREKYIQLAKDIDINLDHSELSGEKLDFLEFLGQNRDIFATNLSEMGCTDIYSHKIDTGHTKPIMMWPNRTKKCERIRDTHR